MATSTFQTRTFPIQYAGLVPQINANIDPSGRTDLLKVLDRAQVDGHITLSPNNKSENALLELDHQAVVVRSQSNNGVLLVIPLHMLASVGYVVEDDAHIVALKVGEVYESMDFVDLAVLLVKEKKVAEDICHHFDDSFQRLYRETMAGTVGLKVDAGPVRSILPSNFSPKSDVVSSFGPSNVYGVTEVPFKTKHRKNSNALSLNTSSTSISSKTSLDRINEYLTMLSVCLSHEELNRFALLLKRWRGKEMPVLEFAQKLMELYGPERKHLLARMKSLLRDVPTEELVTLSDFLRQNGVTENAAVSLSASTGDFSAATDSSLPTSDEFRFILDLSHLVQTRVKRPRVSSHPSSRLKRSADGELVSNRTSERPNGVAMSSSTTMENSHHKSQSSGGFRGLFNKLRKPSEHASQVQIGTRVYDSAEIQKLIPQLEETVEKKNHLLQQAQLQIESQQSKIVQLEIDVKTLQTECDKLRSVLSQKAESAASPPTPQPKTSQTDDPHAEIGQEALQKKVLPADVKTNEPRAKKLAVSAEPAKLDQHKATLQHHPKSAGSKQLIRDAVQKNDFLRQLAKEQVIELVECMFEMRARAGQWIIQEGEPGDRLFVVAEGQLQVSREGQALGVMNPGVVMGELAILYNCTRTASIQALTDVVLWVLDRSAFQMITMRLGMERHSQLMNFLHKVSIFENLPEDRISKMADVMDQDYYAGGHYIIREGEKGDTFFVINSGQVQVTQTIEGESEPREIRILKQGDFFGERALLGDESRTANVIAMNPGVEVLTLDRESFLKLIGDLEALKRDYGDLQRRATLSSRSQQEHPSPTKESREPNEFASLQLRQLKRIATLGVGGFGRVELVCIGGDKSRTFALKALKKKHIVDTRQQEHIFAERNIMMETRNDWIVRLFTTFRDSKYVYMLLEACLGGELWTTLRDRGHFDDYTARFYVACVLEGLEYLHHKNIVYRDLKPENCLLTTSGYLKLVDFGFAKRLASGRKTWTFCGTPEYVSPEIILNKGHDQAADYWALGIYICELMLGRPPFQASDPMKTYTLILKGIDALEIPNRRIGKTATALVKKLCRDNPGERLGSGSGGVNDIRKHRWFMGFDWEGLRTRTLKPPIIPKVTNPADVSNFDNYPPDQDVPPDEFSGWDEGF